MKIIFGFLLLLITIQVCAQNYPITGITITLPPNPDANITKWSNGTSMLSISAVAKAGQGGRIDPALESSRILVIIKKGANKVCGSFESQTAPSANFNSISKVWSGSNAVSLLGQECILVPGDYQLCVQFFGNGPVGPIALSDEKCKLFTIKGMEPQVYQPPQLLMPANETVFTEGDVSKPITFRWTPVLPKPTDAVTYRLRVWQLMTGQNSTQAIAVNTPIVTKDVANATQFTQIIKHDPDQLDDEFIWNVQALNRDGKPIGSNNGTSEVFSFRREHTGSAVANEVILVTPTNNSKIKMGERPTFVWKLKSDQDLPPGSSYKIKIVEIKGDESPDNAFRTNKPFFEKDSLNELTFSYPSIAPAFKEEKKYAWIVQVTGNRATNSGTDQTSAPFMFSVAGETAVKIDSIKLSCTNTYGIYGYTVYVTNPLAMNVVLNGFWCRKPGDINLTQVYNIISQTPANSTQITANSQMTITGQVNLSTQPANTFVRFTLKTYKVTDPVDNATVTDSLKIPDCSCKPCRGKSTTFGNAVAPTITSGNDGSVSVSSVVTHTPFNVIKVSAEIVDVERLGESGCLRCTKESKEFGNYTGGSLNNNGGIIVNGSKGYGKQIQWQFGTATLVNNFSYNLQMIFPPLTEVSCCKDSIRICTRWSFTDANCITCDTLICSVIVREYKKPSGPLIPASSVVSQVQKMGEPFISWFNQDSDELPKDFEEQSRQLYQGISNKEVDLPKFIERNRVIFYGIRAAKYGIDGAGKSMSSAATMCGNGDFETGSIDALEWVGASATVTSTNNTFSPWVTGFLPANGLPINASIGVSSNHHTIVDVGTDPALSSLTRVPTLPSGNQYSLRLGNNYDNNGAEKITKTFTVPSSNNVLSFWYASVFEDGGHSTGGNPSFRVNVYNNSGALVPNLVYLNAPGTPQNVIVADTANPFFIKVNSGLVARPWTCAKIDLSSLANQTVTIELINTDCTGGGHYGYTYLDNFCLGCQGSPSGDVTIQPIANPCVKQGLQVCVNYTLPKIGTTTGSGTIKLMFYQNGNPISYSLTSPNLTTQTGNHCFNIDPSQLPCTTASSGWDIVATGNFSITVGSTTTPVTVTSPDPVGNYQGVKPGFNNDLICCATLADNCCTSFIKTVTTAVAMVGNTTTGFNAVKFTPTFHVGPKLIKQVRISVVNFETSSSNKECLSCETTTARYGSMTVPQNFSGGGKDGIEGMGYPTPPIIVTCLGCPPNWNALPSSEVTWGSNSGPGYNLMDNIGDQTTNFTILLPKKIKLSCCDDTIKICIKYSFTDVDCRTCDTIICYKIVNRTTITQPAASIIKWTKINTGGIPNKGQGEEKPFATLKQMASRHNQEKFITALNAADRKELNSICYAAHS
jgi:hypothetical protein